MMGASIVRSVQGALLLLCAGLTPCAQAAPRPPAGADAEDRTQEAMSGGIAYLCSADRSSVVISSDTVDLPEDGYSPMKVEPGSLVIYSADAEGGTSRRTGVRTVQSNCGELVVSIHGGFYNDDPLGELGAVDDYAVITVLRDGKVLVGPVAIGVCSEGNPRYDTFAECPAGWATRVTVHTQGRDWIELQHTYNEMVAPSR
jgi:hypothetical protein